MSDNLLHKNKSDYAYKEQENLPDSKSILKESPVMNSDKIKIHEFTRENIVAPYDESVDHFTFKSEDDVKYNFLKPKYFFSSHTMLKAFYWSIGIGTSFFLHRYYRKQIFKNALRWGLSTMTASFFFLWGNFELQPFVMSYYYSNYITELSVNDMSKSLNENMKSNRNFDHLMKMKKLNMEIVFEDSNFLNSFEKTIKEIEKKITFSSPLDNTSLTNEEELCKVDLKLFMKLESFKNYPDLTEGQMRKLSMIKKEVEIDHSNDQMLYINTCLINSKNFLNSGDNAPLENDLFYINVLS